MRRQQRAADPEAPEQPQANEDHPQAEAEEANLLSNRLSPVQNLAALPDAPEADRRQAAEDTDQPGDNPLPALSPSPLSASSGRRAAGALESAVLEVLWHASAPMSPGEVRERLTRTDAAAAVLSYSTVVTILTRLHEKGSLSRERDGRAYRYAPVSDEAGLAARRLSQLLDRSPDREAVLSRFVADLSEQDEDLLRSLLGAATPFAPAPAKPPAPHPATPQPGEQG